jgi:hypothetical protein
MGTRRFFDQWHKYEAKMEAEALREWCAANSLEFLEESRHQQLALKTDAALFAQPTVAP